MKKLLTALLFCIPLALAAPEGQPYGPGPHSPDGECWEIVTDIYIGVQTECLTGEERAASTNEWLHLKGAAMCGLRVKRVLPDSPAEKGGLKEGDIILLNSGCHIASMEDLLMSVRNMRPGDIAHFSILRDGVQMPVSFRIGGLPQPVVVAHARLLREGEDQPKWCPGAGPRDEHPLDRGLSPQAALAAKQARIAALLAAEVPDLQAIRMEIRNLNALFPDFGRPGQIRLYYETDFGYVTVTCFQEGVTVTLQSGKEMQAYQLRQQGDTLPEGVRMIFSAM